MFRKIAALGALSLSVLTVSTPASAATVFDAFTSFNATNGTGGFSYGGYNGVTFTAFTQNTDCRITGITCLRGATADLPSVFKADGSQGTNGTVILSTDRLLAHPGEFADAVYIAFTAAVAGTYTYSAQFNQQDSNTAQHNVGITEFFLPGVGPAQFFGVGAVNQGQPSILTGFTQTLAVGDTVGYIIDKNGVYFNDSTGFNFTLSLSAVPEPGTWAMMIGGFGFVGAAMRRRRASVTFRTA